MHPNHERLNRLYTALNDHDHEAVAECYAPAARFRDIAFDWDRRDDIHDMWRMICHGDVHATFEIHKADATDGFAYVVFTYMFGATENPPGRLVRNPTISTFGLDDDGLILSQKDECDPKAWARMALGNGPRGFLAGRIRLLRSHAAKKKLDAFLNPKPHPA
jgi:hypothetical protein